MFDIKDILLCQRLEKNLHFYKIGAGAGKAVVINLQPLLALVTTKIINFIRVINGVVIPKDIFPLDVLLILLLSLSGA